MYGNTRCSTRHTGTRRAQQRTQPYRVGKAQDHIAIYRVWRTMFATLTDEQKCTLADLVTEHAGVQRDFARFCDYLLLLFDEAPGFETLEPSRALLRELWRTHCARSATRAPLHSV
jgi:hypothetical protein